MEKCLKSKVSKIFNEHIAGRKAMFIPLLCVFTFMLVGYAAIDGEAPVINSERISLPYGEEFNPDAVDVTDNQSSRENIAVEVDMSAIQNDQLGSYAVEVVATDEFYNEAVKTIYVDVIDAKGPQINVQGASEGYVIQVPVKGSSDITSYVTAIDDVDGDVTPFIEADKALTTDAISVQSITLTVSDSSGNKTEQTYDFAVADFTAPEITLTNGENPVINYGETFELSKVATVTDNYDEEVTTTIEGNVDTTLLDTNQEITIKAVDSSGNEAVHTVNVTIKDTEAPVVTIRKGTIEVNIGDSVDLAGNLYSATDNKDGDVKANVTYGSVSTSTSGTKEVVYSVTDSSGNTGSETLKVVVKEEEPTYGSSATGGSLVAAALAQLGEYQDCTKMVEDALASQGIYTGNIGPSGFYRYGTVVPSSQAQPGDIIIYSGHVAIYIGNGQAVHGGYLGNQTVISSVGIAGTPTFVRPY